MKALTKVYISVATLIGTLFTFPQVQQFAASTLGAFASHNPRVASILAVAEVILALIHDPKNPGDSSQRNLFPLILLALVVFQGCAALRIHSVPPPERLAYDTLVAAKGFLGSEANAHPECGPNLTANTPVCSDLRTAVAAKDLIADALEIYCGGAGFSNGRASNPPRKGAPGDDDGRLRLDLALLYL